MSGRLKTQLKKGMWILYRRYPWQVHFQFETLTWQDIKSLISFFASGKPLRDGGYIPEYEEKFREAVDPRGYAFSFGAGRIALYVILEALDIGEGDEVILPPFTCEVVLSALLYRKIRPVFVDIEPRTFNIDVSKLQEAITPRTKAIIAQHTFGVPCEVDRIKEIADRHRVYVIEDCALALGSSYKGRPVGSFGDAAIFSTDRTKITSTLMGGIAFTMNKKIADKIEAIYSRTPFLSKWQTLNIGLQVLLAYFLMSPFTYYWGQVFFLLGWKLGLLFWTRDNKKTLTLPRGYPYPCRLSNLQAMLGLNELQRLKSNLELRKAMIAEYVSILRANSVPLNYTEQDIENLTLRFSLLLKDRDGFTDRWLKYFDVGRWFDSPAPGMRNEMINYHAGSCPNAELVHRHIVNFPTHQRSPVVRRFLYKVMSGIRHDEVVIIPSEATN